MDAYKKFREIFWDAFHRPDLKSEKFELMWERAKDLNDLIAGPLFSIYENGQCDYIFKDKDRFPKMENADSLFGWCIEIINQYKDLFPEASAETETEKRDLQILLYQTDKMMELADLAYEIIHKPSL